MYAKEGLWFFKITHSSLWTFNAICSPLKATPNFREFFKDELMISLPNVFLLAHHRLWIAHSPIQIIYDYLFKYLGKKYVTQSLFKINFFINVVFISLNARLICFKPTMLTLASSSSWTITLAYLSLKIKVPLPPCQYFSIRLQLPANSLSIVFIRDIQNRTNLPVFWTSR